MTRHAVTCLMTVTVLGLNPVRTPAASPEAIADVRCLLASVAIMNTPNNTTRAAAATSALYFLGRLDGRDLAMDLENLIRMESQKMSQNDIASESKRCGRELSARARVVSAIGQQLTK
jgi:hypothetical protein